MSQAMQRIVDARRSEQREWLMRAGWWLVGAVSNAVVHRGEIGQIEYIAHQLSAVSREIAFDVIVFGERKMHGNGLCAGADFERGAVIF